MKTYKKLLFALLLLFIPLTGCTVSRNITAPYGTYQVEEVKFMPLFSSSSPDYFLANNKGVLYLIGEGSFCVDISSKSTEGNNKTEYEGVTYVEEELDHAIITMGGDIGNVDISSFNKKVCYKVMNDDEDTGFRVYCLDKEVWIAHFSWYGTKRNAWWADYIFGVKYIK